LDVPTLVKWVGDFADAFGSDGPLADAIGLFFANGGAEAIVVRCGSDPDVRSAMIGSPTDPRGVHALADTDFGLLALPGTTDVATLADAAAYAASRRALLIADAPVDVTISTALAQAVAPLANSPDIALYAPWLDVGGKTVASCGAVAGVIGRIDLTRGVWRSPAGGEATIGDALPHVAWTDADQSVLVTAGINVIRHLPAGTVVWGARTLAGADAGDAQWRYVAVRRMNLFIERSLARGLAWTVFEANGPTLWTRVVATVEPWLLAQFKAGAFMGTKPAEAYEVRCDRTTTTESDLAAGIVNLIVGFAPLRPAEFVVIRIALSTADAACA
jgi:uncharacterized protein